MDHELKQRLIGAVVVTALAAIFIPMLFDDPVDTSGKTVTELTIPEAPADASSETAEKLPVDKAQVMNRPDMELSVSELDEDANANSKGESQANMPIPDGEQTQQQGIVADTGADIQEDEPADDLTPKQPNQNAEPSLDTGVVQGAKPPKNSQGKPANTSEAEKIPEQIQESPVKKSTSNTVSEEKPAAKSTGVKEKTKAAVKSHQDTEPKSGSKLVRWSIQAGSFNKRENAQAFVEKLRKQGFPAAIVTKGDLYRIKIGPELDKKKAAAMKAKLDSQNIKSYLHSE
jgi:DedD protein